MLGDEVFVGEHGAHVPGSAVFDNSGDVLVEVALTALGKIFIPLADCVTQKAAGGVGECYSAIGEKHVQPVLLIAGGELEVVESELLFLCYTLHFEV